MGRHHHHLKLPDHLYLSPPATAPPPQNSFTASFSSVRSAVYYTSSAALLQDSSTSARAVRDKIPGFKTSAAFLATLRANLNLETDSAPDTPDSLRPVTMASSTGSLPPPSPLAQQSQDLEPEEEVTDKPNTDPLSSVPALSTALAANDDDRVEGLHLIADTVAQQRQFASRAVLFHPITLCLLVLFLGLIYQYKYTGSNSDWAFIGTTFAGVVMAALVTTRWLGGGFIFEAERVGTWVWLDAGRKDDSNIVGDSDDIFLTRFGNEVIGALAMRGVRDSSSSNLSSPASASASASATTTSSTGTTSTNSSSPRKRKPNSQTASTTSKNTPPKALIRAWSVKYRYRGKGVGTALLSDAVALAQSKGWTGPEFASDHAHSKRVLPPTFNARFARAEKRAIEKLEKVKEEAGAAGSGTVTGGKKGKR